MWGQRSKAVCSQLFSNRFTLPYIVFDFWHSSQTSVKILYLIPETGWDVPVVTSTSCFSNFLIFLSYQKWISTEGIAEKYLVNRVRVLPNKYEAKSGLCLNLKNLWQLSFSVFFCNCFSQGNIFLKINFLSSCGMYRNPCQAYRRYSGAIPTFKKTCQNI